MVTWAYDVYDVDKAYIYIERERGGMGRVLPPAKNVIISPTWKNPPH